MSYKHVGCPKREPIIEKILEAPLSSLVLGAGAETIRMHNNSLLAFDQHRRNLTKIRSELENLVEYGHSTVLWAVETPVYWERLNESHKMITNEAVSQYNAEASRVKYAIHMLMGCSHFQLYFRCFKTVKLLCGPACSV